MTYSIDLLLLDDHANWDLYLSIWRGSHFKRPHDHPAYMELMKPHLAHSSVLIFYKGSTPLIIYPFYWIYIKDKLNGNIDPNFKHCISAYGYGGPICVPSTISHEDENAFRHLYSTYMLENGFISEFIREDLFNTVSQQCTRHFKLQNVVVNLNKSVEELMSTYKYSVRKNIKRAIKSGLRAAFDFEGSCLDDFISIYHTTMERTKASSYFLITKSKFEAFNQYLLQDSIGFYIHIYHDNAVISSELVLCSANCLYSFLGGMNMAYTHFRPNDFLKHNVNLWGIDHHYSQYILGGGVQNEDGIFKYKLTFNPEGSRPFYVRHIIHDKAVYDELVNLKKVNSQNWKPNIDFFPLYFS